MNKIIKTVLMAMMLFAVVLVISSCGADGDQYAQNDRDGYTVSVRYDANGGQFTTNTTVIVDSYDISGLQTGAEGNVELSLLSPDSSVRGVDAFKATLSNHFLAGWYAQRTETTDEQGNVKYTYSQKWDFDTDKLSVDASKTYTSSEPVVTLYAVWIPFFEIEFCDKDTGAVTGSIKFDPTETENISIPRWNEETGAVEMFEFPQKKGYTYNATYLDANGTVALEGESFVHSGVIDYTTGTATNTKMTLYVDWTEGEWYRIYTAEQFIKNASVSGCYEICADLDFEGKTWPTNITYANFSGKINGNGHTFKNIGITQSNNSKTNVGLFGNLTESSTIKNVTFENITFTVKAGTRVAGTSYGVLAGAIASGAVLDNITVKNSTLQIDSGAYFGTEDYNIGLLCGMGDIGNIDISGISCKVVGDSPDSVKATVNGNEVTLEFVSG